MVEEPSKRPVGSVLVIGAGVAAIRAVNDLAVVGYEILLTDRTASAIGLLARLGATPSDERCGLCDIVPEQERHLAHYFCMRNSLTAFADRITALDGVAVAVGASGDGDGAFSLTAAGQDPREVDAVILAGSGLADDRAADELDELVAQLGGDGPATEPTPVHTPVAGLFACGPAIGATSIEGAQASGSAAAGAASRHLHRRGRGFVGAIKRVNAGEAKAELRTIPVVQQALVVGGGVAGMHAALALATRGIEVQLVAAGALGEGAPDAQRDLASDQARAVDANDLITVLQGKAVVQTSGTVGRFLTVVRATDDEEQELQLPHGATILATEGPGSRYDNVEIARLFGVEQYDGRLQEASKWKPVDFLAEGMYLARGDEALPATLLAAEAAAHRAYRYLSKREITTARVTSRTNHEICSTCEICISLCPYEARALDSSGTKIVINERVCEGCGVCAANCPDQATDLIGTADEQTMQMIDSALEDLQKILP